MQNISKYDLIIFDCDGTLVDSEMAHNKVLLEQLHALGLTEYTPEKTMETFAGRAITDIVERVEKEHSVRFPDHHWEKNQALYKEILPNYMRLDPTCRPLLEKLKEVGQKMAVGSNGTRDNVLGTIRAAGFDEFFPDEFIFTFEMVRNPKPAPDLYLHVCEAMHATPDKAIVIEDTVPGALAGLAANIDTVGYTGLSHRDGQFDRLKAIDCTHVITAMGDLDAIIYPHAKVA
jgi:HAD superfamily hydrolase (TIGR01509 family)